ncbi:hypothetical protein Smp_127480 [Schistosoma mansoni]|uniref:hypothetical protein n=1 Tax=Schistosoma mansoni TaxID=6183 RepID=UPI00022DC624|nr:hypothetical protein Smp_127480 [Schistosoma mansoni]|eukprot:XP_018651069.1 hypothetical protein Smp_127480 [Schistosoma mansoni]
MNEELSKIESFLKGDSAVNRQLSSRAWLSMYGLKNNKIDRSSVLQNIGFPVRGGKLKFRKISESKEYHHCLGKYIKSCYGDNLFVRITNDRTGDVYNVIAKKGYIKQLKMKITQAVDLYRDRLTWLTSGSRSIFGVIQEHSAVFLLDIKTQSPEIFSDFVNSLKCLISEQIANMKMINMIRCQDEPYFFSDELVSVDTSTLKNMLEWINTLERLSFSSSSCTTDCILRMGQFKKSFESVYLITEGESTMTSPELLENIVKTLKHPLHIVSYCCEDMKTIDYLHNLCTYTGGRFHAYCINTHIPSYSPSCWDVEQFQQKIHVNKVEYGGPPKGWGQHEDCVLIFEELEEARSLLQRIEEVLHDIDRIPDEVLKDSNYECSQPAPITNSCEFGWKREEYMSSKEWLSIHGLKAQHLDFYDLLVSVSFKHCDGVVNVLKPPLNVNNNDAMDRECNKIYDDFGKSNHSEADSKDSSQIWSSNAIIQPKLINAQYCSNFVHIRWKNGNIVHVQITPEMYRSYSRRMHSRLNAIKHRLDLLRQGSRELFGTITEDNFIFIYVLLTSNFFFQYISLSLPSTRNVDSFNNIILEQSKWNTTTNSIVSTVTNNPAEFIRCLQMSFHILTDTYYPNLQNLYKTSLTIPNWLSHNGLAAKKLRLTDLLKSFTVRLRPTYIPALRHHVVSEVLKQTLPIAYVNKKKFTRKHMNINIFLCLIKTYNYSLIFCLTFFSYRKLIEIIFEYIDNDSLNNLRKDVNLDKYKKWRSKLCCTGNPHRSYRSLKQMNSTFDDRAPCGHPYRIHH